MERRRKAKSWAPTAVGRADHIRVSRRLLARLLMFHGVNPPDDEAAAAVKHIGTRIRRAQSGEAK